MLNNKLVARELDGRMIPMVSTLQVAERLEAQHKNVMRKVREAMEIDEKTNGLKKDQVKKLYDMMVISDTYTDKKGEERQMYLLNEEAFVEVMMTYKNNKAKELRFEYRTMFKEMKEQLSKIAEGHVETFVETLSLTRYSIESYLPKFLTYKNVDEVVPALCNRICNLIDEGEEKLELLSTTIRVIKNVRNKLDNSAQRELLTIELEKVTKQRDKIMIARQGGLATANKVLEQRIQNLQNNIFETNDYRDFINSLGLSVDYEGFSKSIKSYVNIIVDNTNLNYKEVWKELYDALTRASMGRNYLKDDYKKLGYVSRLEYVFYEFEGLSNFLLNEAYNWSKKFEMN